MKCIYKYQQFFRALNSMLSQKIDEKCKGICLYVFLQLIIFMFNFFSEADGFWIHKSCALGPCSLRDESQSSGLGLDNCDRSQDEYDCISCCRQDGCNTGSGAIYPPQQILIFSLILVVLLEKTKIFA